MQNTSQYLPEYSHTHLLVVPAGEERGTVAQTYIPLAQADHHPDVHWIAERNPGIGVVRQLRPTLLTSPLQSPFTYVVFLHAEELSLEAQHALLKSLEEPPRHVIFLLCTSSPHALLPTIVSRCVTLFAKKPEKSDKKHIPAENFQQMNLADAIHAAELHGAHREDAITYCESLLNQLHEHLHDHPEQSLYILRLLQTVATAISRLKRNVHTRLTVESMFFTLSRP